MIQVLIRIVTNKALNATKTIGKRCDTKYEKAKENKMMGKDVEPMYLNVHCLKVLDGNQEVMNDL